MEAVNKPQNVTDTSWLIRVRLFFNCLGPGILAAAAAIGASHLVSSTRAGADFGWQLVWVILAVNILKYPFFAAGARYTAATGESLLKGYLRQGKGYLWFFTALNAIAAVASTAGVSLLAAAMLTLFIPLPINYLTLMVLVSSLGILIFGHYSMLDRLTKLIMIVLTLATLIAVTLALTNDSSTSMASAASPSPWHWASLGFLVAMMGWMPAPIEVTSWNSLWLLEKQKSCHITKKQALLDFNLGYILTAVLAIAFLALGALVMHGSGEHFSNSGTQFAIQLIDLYTSVMGENSRYLIGIVALLCIFSTTVTVIDGYGRTLDNAWELLTSQSSSQKRITILMLVISGLSLFLMMFFEGALLPLLTFVMILAFMTTVIFAWFNYKLMVSSALDKDDRYGTGMKILSWLGLTYLVGFALLFIYWYLWVQ